MKTYVILIIIGGLIILSVLAALTILWFKKLAKRDFCFTTLGNGEGKLIAQEDKIVDVITSMPDVHYDKNGELVEMNNPRNYGSLYKELGIIWFGLSPLKKVYEFKTSWSDYVEREAKSVKKLGSSDKEPIVSYDIVPRSEKLKTFKRFYTHAIVISKIETKSTGDTTIKVDMVYVVTFEVTNIIKVITKIKPDGIILAQAETGFTAALQDLVNKYSYDDLKSEDKSAPDSDFVEKLIRRTNEIIEEKFHMTVYSVEMKNFDLSLGEPGDEELLRATKAKQIAELEAEALEQKGKGIGKYFTEIGKAIGPHNLGKYVELEQVKGTNLIMYGSETKPPLITVPISNKKGEK